MEALGPMKAKSLKPAKRSKKGRGCALGQIKHWLCRFLVRASDRGRAGETQYSCPEFGGCFQHSSLLMHPIFGLRSPSLKLRLVPMLRAMQKFKVVCFECIVGFLNGKRL